MDISSIESEIFVFLLILISLSCKYKSENKDCIPLYQFNQEIIFEGFKDEELALASINFKDKPIRGKIVVNNKNEQKKTGRLHFENLEDFICKSDTLSLFVANEEFLLTEITQMYADVSLGNDRPAFIEFKIDGEKFRSVGYIKK